MNIIRVRPAPPLRREFAAWAVAQQPKIRTLSTDTFAVPVGAYVDAPEGILLGALVDNHLYVPVADTLGDPEQPQIEPGSEATGLSAAPASDELLGVTTPEGLQDGSGRGVEPGQQLACGDCDRTFGSRRGLRAHRHRAHPADQPHETETPDAG